MLKILLNCAIILALLTIVLGAYTRLTDAGLGCPDWPGCYGAMSAPKQAEQLQQAQQNFPGAKIEPHKARNEMLHRYIAGLLGLTIASIFLLCQWQKHNRLLSLGILLLVFMQAALGMWTVTLNLLPLVVLGHLLGGFSLLCLLVLLRLKNTSMVILTNAPNTYGSNTYEPNIYEPKAERLMPFACFALIILIAQISLGAWTSSNYAALACHQLPLCEPGWQDNFSLSSAFSLPQGYASYQYGVLAHDARLSIHVLHRIGALVTFVVLGSFAVIAWRVVQSTAMRRLSIGLLGLLSLQCILGLLNVIAYVPLANAVAHNFVAANLLMLLVVFIDQLYQRRHLYN